MHIHPTLVPRALLLGAALAMGCAAPRQGGTAGAPPGTSPAPDGPRGSLVIVGGGPTIEVIQQRFITLAGGAGKANIIVFPMASALETTGPASVRGWERLGARAWSVNLTREQANSADFARALDSATGIWFPGGDQNRITRVLLGTAVGDAIKRRYMAGAAVGGTSAGAAIMSELMLTGEERSPGGARPDTSQNWITIARDNVVLAPGLGLLPGAIIDQHFLRRRRTNRLISVTLERPSDIGVGLDESTALVVEPGNRWSVVGASTATIFDARQAVVTPAAAPVLGAASVRMHVLPAGSSFDPRTGTAALPPR